jgi:hypothetical protein
VLRCFSVQACAFNSSLVIWFCVNRSCMILAADAGQYQYTRGCSMHKVFILSVFFTKFLPLQEVMVWEKYRDCRFAS